MGAINYSNRTISYQMVLFYDGPEPPEGFYDDLLDLPNSGKFIIQGDLVKFMSYLIIPTRERALFDGVPMLRYSEPVLKASIDDLKAMGDKLFEKDEDILFSFNIEPLESDIFTHGAPSAYPPDRSHTILPSVLFVGWNDKSQDEFVYDSARSLTTSLIEAGIKDGQDLKDAAIYPNYVVDGTPLEAMYGKNVKRLREIKKKYDPYRVMDLTGGFRF